MGQGIKDWLIEVGIRKMGPSAIRGGILGLSAWFISKEGLLSPYGIVSDAVHHTTTIYWDQVSTGLIIALPAVIAAFLKMTSHQGAEFFPPKENQQDTPPTA